MTQRHERAASSFLIPCCSLVPVRRDYSSASTDPKPILQHAADEEEEDSQQRKNKNNIRIMTSKDYQFPLDVLRQLDMDPDSLHALASQHPTPLSLADMYKYASGISKDQRLYNAQFLHKEIAIRIAQRAVDLLTLPLGLSEAEPIRQVARLYLHYVKQLQETPLPTTPEHEDKFTQLLQSFVLDRSTIPTQIARGVAEWNLHTASLQKQQQHINQAAVPTMSNDYTSSEHAQERQDVLEEALYRFFTARVGLRFLIEHHVVSSTTSGLDYRKLLSSVFPKINMSEVADNESAFTEPHNNATKQLQKTENAISAGCIQSNLNVVQETRMVAELVKAQTIQAYGCCPDIHIVDCIQPKQQEDRSSLSSGQNRGFTYVPHHLHYMLAELLMNSCRSTVRVHQQQNGQGKGSMTRIHSKSKAPSNSGSVQYGETVAVPSLPPIRVVLVMGKEDITIKVCDKGGGIPRCK
jgi:pyruvate dehydrogenase kinase 2/3/4